MKAVIDRIEGKLVVLELEGKAEVIWPVEFLPKDIKSGNILNIDISLNKEEESKQRKKIINLQKKLEDN